jgi:hypothetical protein
VIGTRRYIECSARTQRNITVIFEEATRVVVNRQECLPHSLMDCAFRGDVARAQLALKNGWGVDDVDGTVLLVFMGILV